jgi:phosphoribosylformylglycinamidine cyclo-ligase
MTDKKSAYARAGVDIDAQETALERIKDLVQSTRIPGVLSEQGSFGGLFQPDLRGIQEPVLVASADGVGTKLMVARLAGDYSTVGRDLVNHCVNDILVQGAIPLFFLDYVGTGVLEPEAMEQLVSGVAAGCRENDCALLGGETAEMAGFYQAGDYELVGFIVGMVDRSALFDGSRVEVGDLLLGLPSAGLHTNGYTLAREVFFESLGLGVDDEVPGLGRSLREVLLAPHLSYLSSLKPLLSHPALHGLAHITGGGLTDNLPRILPKGCHAFLRVGSWEIPPLFQVLQEQGEVETEEMFRVFNMGIGMVLAVAAKQVGEVLAILRQEGQKAAPIGTVQEGDHGVAYEFGKVEDP